MKHGGNIFFDTYTLRILYRVPQFGLLFCCNPPVLTVALLGFWTSAFLFIRLLSRAADPAQDQVRHSQKVWELKLVQGIAGIGAQPRFFIVLSQFVEEKCGKVSVKPDPSTLR